jgi:hypothetical protein
VYYQNGDYKSSANLTAPSTVNFNFVENAAISPNQGGGYIAPSLSYSQITSSGYLGGTRGRYAAVLTNGNIVQVWMANANSLTNGYRPIFRIVNSSNTVVVSPTLISSVYYNGSYENINVAALTGGGFAVTWVNTNGGTANTVNYAIYSNTGSSVTAATQDTSFSLGNAYSPIEITGLPNGGFAIAAKPNSGATYLRAYGATGTPAYTAQNTGITGSVGYTSFAIAARSDNSVFVCDKTSAGVFTYVLYNSSGSAIVSATTFTVDSTSNFSGADASVLSDGTTIVIAYNAVSGSYLYPFVRFLPTGNTLSAATTLVPTANLFYQSGTGGNCIGILVLSNNNFIVVFSDYYNNMQYAFFNSSGTCISGSNTSGTIPQLIPGGYAQIGCHMTLIESSGYVYAYWTNNAYSSFSIQQYYCKINTSTYALTPFTSTTGGTTSLSGLPAGAQIASTVNPNSASYYSTSSSSTVSSNVPSIVSGPTVVSSSNCDAIASCTLPNGNFVIAWRNASTYVVSAYVYSPTGTLITSINVGTGYASSIVFSVKVASLSGGGFVVGYYAPNASSTNVSIYSSSYSLVSSSYVNNNGGFSTSYNFDLVGLQNNYWVIAFINGSNYSQVIVYDTAFTNLFSYSLSSNLNQGIALAANSWGGFALSGFGSGYGYCYNYTFIPYGTANWTVCNTTATSSFSAFVQNPQMACTPSGIYVMTGYYSGYPAYSAFIDVGSPTVQYTSTLTSWPTGSSSNPTSYPMMGVGLTGNGNLAIATSYDGANMGIAALPSNLTNSNANSLPYSQVGGSSTVTMFSKSSYSLIPSGIVGIAAQPRITAGVGNNFILTYRNASGYPTFLISVGTNLSYVYSVTANTTPSALVPIAPTPGSSSNIVGVFSGVAATTASAGSTGQLVINGPVLLGSSYTSTASGGFDSTGSAVRGVRGTFNGRSVNLQGNT